MSARSLGRRLDALAGGQEPAEVIEALRAIDKTGAAPPGRAGERAQGIWDEVVRKGVDPEIRYLAAYMRATGKSLAELFAEVDGYGDAASGTPERTTDEREAEVD